LGRDEVPVAIGERHVVLGIEDLGRIHGAKIMKKYYIFAKLALQKKKKVYTFVGRYC
jgi:hypothetical protein